MENSLFYAQFSPLKRWKSFIRVCNFKISEGACPQTPLENVDC